MSPTSEPGPASSLSSLQFQPAAMGPRRQPAMPEPRWNLRVTGLNIKHLQFSFIHTATMLRTTPPVTMVSGEKRGIQHQLPSPDQHALDTPRPEPSRQANFPEISFCSFLQRAPLRAMPPLKPQREGSESHSFPSKRSLCSSDKGTTDPQQAQSFLTVREGLLGRGLYTEVDQSRPSSSYTHLPEL